MSIESPSRPSRSSFGKLLPATLAGVPWRYARIYASLWSNSVVREMQFKANFVLWLVVETLWFALQLTFMSVIYSHTDSIAGWSKWEVVLLVGCNYFIQQLFIAFIMTNITELSELIRTG